jgi:hypothetical protein
MRHSSCTVVVLVGPAPAEVLATVGRSMNVALIRPDAPGDGDSDGMQAAAGALRRAGQATSPYALVPADPLAAVAASWQAMWDVSRQPGPAEFEQEAARAVSAWRAHLFEWPDYYLVLAADPADRADPAHPAHPAGTSDPRPDFHLGPLRSVRPHRVAFVPAVQPAEQATGVLRALGSLRHGPWWPGLDEVIESARTFYPGRLAEGNPLTVGPDHQPAGGAITLV